MNPKALLSPVWSTLLYGRFGGAASDAGMQGSVQQILYVAESFLDFI
jgi:hypothetical protein